MSQSQFLIFPVRGRTAGLLCAALIGPLLLSQCKSTKPQYEKTHYTDSKLATPPHHMAQSDYPFDKQGRYRKDWVQSKSSSSSSSSRTSAGSRPVPVSAPPTPRPAPKPVPAARYHTVKSGDTLFAISRKYGTSVAKLKSVNGLTSDLIRIGQTLRIP